MTAHPELTKENVVPYFCHNLKMTKDGVHYGTLEAINLIGDTLEINWGGNAKSREPIIIMKPLLHPIERITEEIEHNGQRINLSDLLFERFGAGFKTRGHFQQHFIDNILYSPFIALRFETILFLSEYHIDFQGLISKGLALPIEK